ncbi:hypothetical protein BSL78_12564, partial [Apostichopus japonicus]
LLSREGGIYLQTASDAWSSNSVPIPQLEYLLLFRNKTILMISLSAEMQSFERQIIQRMIKAK